MVKLCCCCCCVTVFHTKNENYFSSLVNIFPWNCLLFVYERSLVQNTYIVHEQTLFSGMNVCMFFVRLFRTFFLLFYSNLIKGRRIRKKFDVILACLVESLFKFYMV